MPQNSSLGNLSCKDVPIAWGPWNRPRTKFRLSRNPAGAGGFAGSCAQLTPPRPGTKGLASLVGTVPRDAWCFSPLPGQAGEGLHLCPTHSRNTAGCALGKVALRSVAVPGEVAAWQRGIVAAEAPPLPLPRGTRAECRHIAAERCVCVQCVRP